VVPLSTKRADMIVHEREPLNAEPPRGALADSDLTPLDTFYVRSHGPIPVADPATWRVRVDGLVERRLDLSLDELRERFEPHTVEATLQCAGNRREGLVAVREIPGEAPWGPAATANASWEGVRLLDVLTFAGLRDDAAHVALLGADVSLEAEPPQCFAGSIPRHKALGEEVLLAWQMNGELLPAAHGAPLRAIVPGYIGARSVKWLTQVTAQVQPSDGYFQASTYRLLPQDADLEQVRPGDGIALGAVALNSEILIPDDGATLVAGPMRVTGYAVAGDDRRIERVDVSLDEGGTWKQAELLDHRSAWAWRRWTIELDVPAGTRQIVARAWDSSAATQPENPAHLWNPKGYVNNAWARTGVSVRP